MASEFAPKQHVTIQDIADRCGVTRMTAWRALNGTPKHMSEDTRARIRAVAEEMQYDPSVHQSARRLSNVRTGKAVKNDVIALLLPPEYHHDYFKQLQEGIMSTLMPAGYGLLMYQQFPQPARLPLPFRRGEADGLIVYQQFTTFAPVYAQLREEPGFGARPITLLLERHPGCHAVITDDFAGGYAAAAHLLDLGHRYLLYECLTHQAHAQRHAGYRQAYRDRGIDPAGRLIPVPWDTWHDDYTALTLAMLARHPEVTGVLSAFDTQAVTLCRALHELGHAIPADYSIIGYDDVEVLPDAAGANRLTTIHVPLVAIGRMAATLMLRHLTADAPDDETLLLPTELIVRQTTAPPRSGRAR
jgi:LacI family repressor for deo operon, udp, cdd, tsx, nupC, and nupG